MVFLRSFLENKQLVRSDIWGMSCRSRPLAKVLTITENFKTHGSLGMSCHSDEEDNLTDEHEGVPLLSQNN
jgi:hypothetical protein